MRAEPAPPASARSASPPRPVSREAEDGETDAP